MKRASATLLALMAAGALGAEREPVAPPPPPPRPARVRSVREDIVRRRNALVRAMFERCPPVLAPCEQRELARLRGRLDALDKLAERAAR